MEIEDYLPQHSEAFVIYHLLWGKNHDLFFHHLKPAYFGDPVLKELFTIAARLHESQLFINEVFYDEIKKLDLLQHIEYIISLTKYCPPEGYDKEGVRKIINYIKQEYFKRQIAVDKFEASPEKLAELFSKFEEDGTLLSKESATQFIKKALARDIEKIPYPYTKIEKMLHGIKKKEYTIVAARPSVGKSVFLEQIFWASTLLDKKALFFSLEMSEDAVIKRQILRTTGVNLFKEDIDIQKKAELYDRVFNTLKNSKIAAGGYSVPEMDIIIHQEKPDIVLVDYLQMTATPNPRWSDYERATNITREFKKLLQKYNIALVVACQLNREAQEQPTLSNLRASGQIEQDADVVLSLWKKKEDDTAEMVIEGVNVFVDCLKNRNGRIFSNSDDFGFYLRFNPERVSFSLT